MSSAHLGRVILTVTKLFEALQFIEAYNSNQVQVASNVQVEATKSWAYLVVKDNDATRNLGRRQNHDLCDVLWMLSIENNLSCKKWLLLYIMILYNHSIDSLTKDMPDDQLELMILLLEDSKDRPMK
ncbi:uncharacterized protein BX664DRAFT_317933 [Halteromyces radiatus]|uniref:uncharacterized protein n=1 Tax=Halteromyces radiatus TaxID=101107 RepID=UPI0022207183|nr:uncharacterized protein BX664DRAFT_317933 [Halteromyces radiatus]KAI8080045.1 hypothetical protein BX664DRAFT_317933 [Halteromyces radiatus]